MFVCVQLNWTHCGSELIQHWRFYYMHGLSVLYFCLFVCFVVFCLF